MRILWLSNIILPEFSEEFSLRRNPIGGWMTGFLRRLELDPDIEVGFCFPIIDKSRLKDGKLNSFKYYSFHFDYSTDVYDSKMIDRFKYILNDFCPDVVHIWGTELYSSSAMVEACKMLSIHDKVIIDIQGLVHYISNYHYYANIPEKYISMKSSECTTIEEDRTTLIERGQFELNLLKEARNVFGRTEWDKACVTQINTGADYHFCNRMLRPLFYENIGKWRITDCERHSIFVSQAHVTYKGFHYLLQAMPIVLKKYKETHIYVAGKNPIEETSKGVKPYGVYIKDLIERFDLSENITFLGYIDEAQMVERYMKSHVFISCANIENQCNSVTEAKLLGVPVICSNVGGMYERIDHGTDGFLYQHDAPYMMAYYICRIFENDGLAECFSKNASASMIADTDREENSRRIIDVYKKIANA